MSNAFDKIKQRMQKAKDNDEHVIITESNYGVVETHVLKIIRVYDRYAIGVTTVINDDETYHVKYSINYGSLLVAGPRGLKIIYEGDNSFV